MSKQTKRRTATRLGVVMALALLGIAGARPAQADEWLLVPVGTEEAVGGLEQSLQELEPGLTARGVSVRDRNAAAERFERLVSSPAQTLSDEAIGQWTAHSQRALGLLARNDYEGALRAVEPAQELSRRAVEVLNRDQGTAATLLDTCLYTVRALLGVGKRATARVQAEECARLSPGAEPNTKMHPPDTRAFYEDVVGATRSTAGTLVIESEPSACSARVNGLSMGPTPARVERLPLGSYAVQVECGERPGRVHRASVERGTTRLGVDTDFDEAIRSDTQLWLHYAEPQGSARRTSDSETLGGVLEVDALLFVTAADNARLELELLDATGRERTRAIAIAAPDAAATASQSQALDILLGVPPPARQRPPRGQFIAGVTLASVGTASLLSAYGLYAVSATKLADQMVALPSNDNQAQWLNTRFGMLYVGSAGAAMLVTAMPLALPYRPKTPWWGWLSGGAGLALAATSIALAVTAPPTPDVSRVADPQGYVDRARRTDAAFLAGVTAAPLLTMPLVYLLRREDKRGRAELEPRIVASRNGGFLGIAGSY